jgi:hypothetical protein
MFDNNLHDQIDDQIDTTTRGFLGVTVACARCHDHKYDAISQRDYYALYGVFASTRRLYDLPLLEDPKSKRGGVEFEQQLAKARQELEQHIDAEFARVTENLRQRIGDYLLRAATTKPDLTETTQFGLSLTPDDFRPTLVLRTRRLLEQRANPEDRVFGPWAVLMGLEDDGFATNAAAKVREISSATNNSKWNPLVVSAVAKASLTNKTAVARGYGHLLRDIYEESKKPVAGNPGLTADQKELLSLVTARKVRFGFRAAIPRIICRALKRIGSGRWKPIWIRSQPMPPTRLQPERWFWSICLNPTNRTSSSAEIPRVRARRCLVHFRRC